MLGIATPFVLVFECRDVAIFIKLIQQPDRYNLATSVMAESFIKTESVVFCDTHAFMIASFMVVCGTADGNRCRGPADWGKLDGQEISLSRHLVDCRLLADFASPSDERVLPFAFVVGKVCERVEESRCTTSGAQIPRNCSTTGVNDGVGYTEGGADNTAGQVERRVFRLRVAICFEARPGQNAQTTQKLVSRVSIMCRFSGRSRAVAKNSSASIAVRVVML